MSMKEIASSEFWSLSAEDQNTLIKPYREILIDEIVNNSVYEDLALCIYDKSNSFVSAGLLEHTDFSSRDLDTSNFVVTFNKNECKNPLGEPILCYVGESCNPQFTEFIKFFIPWFLIDRVLPLITTKAIVSELVELYHMGIISE